MSFKYTPNTLKKMEQLLEEANYTIRYEKGTFNSGFCVLEEKRVVVINKFLSVESRINALVEMVPSLKIDVDTLSSEMQKWLKILQDNPDFNKNNSVQQKIDI